MGGTNLEVPPPEARCWFGRHRRRPWHPGVYVRFGSLADIGARIRVVHFTPTSGHAQPQGGREIYEYTP
jgi:hypothetical protein